MRERTLRFRQKRPLAFLQGGHHCQDAGHILGARPTPFFLRSSPEQGLEGFRDLEKADAARPSKLVTAGGDKITAP
jgi:hypothetical protein